MDITNCLCCSSSTFAVNQRMCFSGLCFPHFKVSLLRERLSLITFLSSSNMESNPALPATQRNVWGTHIWCFTWPIVLARWKRHLANVCKDLSFSLILKKTYFCMSKCAKTQGHTKYSLSTLKIFLCILNSLFHVQMTRNYNIYVQLTYHNRNGPGVLKEQ